MKRFFALYTDFGDAPLKQRMPDESEEGFLYSPKNTDKAVGYIFFHRGDNRRIRELFRCLS